MSRYFRKNDELVTAARSALAESGRRGAATVAILAAEVDPGSESPAEPSVGPAATRERVDSDGGTAHSKIDAVVDVVRRSLRAGDLITAADGRITIVLPSATAEDGRAVGERLCAAIRNHRFGNGTGPLTLSVGSAAAPDHGQSFESVHGAAISALARVKAQGNDGASAEPPPHHEPLHRPLSIDRFAGRSQELGSLLQWLDEASAGNPRVISLSGDSGAGTAALLRQLEPEVRLRGGLLAVVASPKRPVPRPYGVWRALLGATHMYHPTPDRQWRELQHLEPALGEPSSSSARTGSQFRLLGELAEYVRSLAQRGPLVLVLDEMQWADATSWDALEHLIDQVDRDRLMICMTHRTDAPADAAALRRVSARRELARELAISSLTRDEVKQWIEGAFHRQPVGRELLAFIYRHTEGNPLFIAQLLRALVEDGAIWHNGTRWEWTPVSELRLPAGRAALIAHRLERFSASTQAVLSTAAIAGREFDIRLLVAAGAGSEAAVGLALSEATSAGLLRHTRERKRGAFAFRHDEIAEVLIDALPKAQRRQIHFRLAQASERLRPDAADEIALHYDAAGETADAYRWGQLAANAAERVYAYEAARAYLQLSARNATSPGELAEVRATLAQVSETRGRFDEVEELCDLAIEWFDGQGDERRSLSLRRLRERARMELGQPARVTLDSLQVLDAEAKRLGFDHESVAVLLMLSQTYGRLGDRRTSERMAAESVAMAERVGDTLLLADAVTRLGGAILSEAPNRAYPILERALSLYEAAGDARGQARTYGNMGVVAQFESRLDDAIGAYTKSVAVARAAGMPDMWGVAALNLGVLSQKCGDYDKARELFSEALGLFAAVKHSEFQLAALYNMAHVEREVGAWETAMQLYETSVSLAQRIGQAEIELGALAGTGLCALELGRLDVAEAALASLDSRVTDRGAWFQGREIVEALRIRIDAREDRRERALQRLSESLEMAEAADVYSAAWLIASCAASVRTFDRGRVEALLHAYRQRVRTLGYPEMTRRFDVLESTGDRAGP